MSPPRNVAASVRQRLYNLSKKLGEDFQALLTRYILERLLYRLSQSEHRSSLILKGAMLFSIWSDEPHRSTRDLDLLGRGESTVSYLEQVFREICCIQVEDDGLEFKEDTVRGNPIKEVYTRRGTVYRIISARKANDRERRKYYQSLQRRMETEEGKD